MPFTAVILAAGRSVRLGRNKQLVEIGGEPLVRRAARRALTAGAAAVVVVVGHEAELVAAPLADLPVSVVANADWAAGMGGSLAVGVRAALAAEPPPNLMVILPDQYEVPAAHLRALAALAGLTNATIVATSYAGTVGAPALFKPAHFAELGALPPDAGAKRLFAAHAAALATVACAAAATDLDTPADLAYLAPSTAERNV